MYYRSYFNGWPWYASAVTSITFQQLLIGAVNAYNQKTNFVKNQLTGEYGVPDTREYKVQGLKRLLWAITTMEKVLHVDMSMEPRFSVVLVKSFARIHETNLKKQGMLRSFANEADYDLIKKTTPSTLLT